MAGRTPKNPSSGKQSASRKTTPKAEEIIIEGAAEEITNDATAETGSAADSSPEVTKEDTASEPAKLSLPLFHRIGLVGVLAGRRFF